MFLSLSNPECKSSIKVYVKSHPLMPFIITAVIVWVGRFLHRWTCNPSLSSPWRQIRGRHVSAKPTRRMTSVFTQEEANKEWQVGWGRCLHPWLQWPWQMESTGEWGGEAGWRLICQWVINCQHMSWRQRRVFLWTRADRCFCVGGFHCDHVWQ